MNAKQLKTLTGAKSKIQGINMIFLQLEKQEFRHMQRVYNVAGIDSKTCLVHFTSTWSLESGGVGHSRIGVPLEDVLSIKDGNITSAVFLH